MNRHRYIFYVILGVLGSLAAIGQWQMYGTAFPVLAGHRGFVFFALSPLLFVIPYVGALKLPRTLTKVLAHIGGYWFIATYYGLIVMIPFFLLRLAAMLTKNGGLVSLTEWYGRLTALILIILLCYGAYVARHPVVRRVEVATGKPLAKERRIAFISDLHLGIVLGKPFVRKLAAQLKEAVPDVLLIGGDIIDGNLEFVLRDGSLSELRLLRDAVPECIAVFGNHDHYGIDIGMERRVLSESGILCLAGESYTTKDGFYIAGMADHMHVPLQRIRKAPDETFSIFMEHEPVQIRPAARAGYDLYVSGHTHAGQFWPNRAATKRIFELDYGMKKYGSMTAVVSSGYGSWGALFRLGVSPEIIVITVRSENARKDKAGT